MQLPQVSRVLPGPAGKLQELAAAGALQQATPEALGLKAGSTCSTSPSQAGNQYDAAFLSSSWAAAKAFAEEDAVVAGPVRSIKSAKELAVGKVPRMLLLLSSYHPSGAGSAFSKVKDPSGTMGAALHCSALQQQPQLGPGCVLLLQNVSVLTPNPGSCYLAVTADNIVQVWGPEQPGRSIRNVTHQPAATQHPQQQQHQHPQQQQVSQQQQQQQQRQQPPHTQQQQQHQQQQQGLFRKAHPGQQQRPGTAAPPAAASGADSRQTNPFIPPPSPDIMSVLNQMSGKGAAPAAGVAGTGQYPPQSRPQQQQQWQQRQNEQFSPALSGAGGGPSVHHQIQQQQQQQPPELGSMPPPPPRAPAATAAAAAAVGGGGCNAQYVCQQQQQQQQQQGRGSLNPSQQREQGPPMGQPLVKGLSQPNSTVGAQGRTILPPAAAGRAGATGTNPPGTSGGLGHRAPCVGSGSARGWGGRATAAAAAAVDDDEDVEVDENIVAAIFGSQVPKPVAPILPPQQQQQQGSSVTGAFISVSTHHTPRAVGSSVAAGSSSSWSQHQQTPISISSSGSQQVRAQRTGTSNSPAAVLGPSHPTASGSTVPGFMSGAGPAGSTAGKMGPPAPRTQQQHQQWGAYGGSQQQQKWGVPGGSQQQQQGTQDRPQLSGVVPGRGTVGGFGGGVLGKRPAAHLSLLDDLVADDLDDF